MSGEDENEAFLASPRALLACAHEGVDPEELQYRKPEDFSEKGLSPRLARLRFEFFEAKRKDLLQAVKQAYDRLPEDEARPGNLSLRAAATVLGGGPSVAASVSEVAGGAIGDTYAGAALSRVLSGGAFAMERDRLERSKEMERSWLRAALQAELVKVQRMEREYSYAREEAAANDDKMKEQARKVREMAQKRKEEAERKAMQDNLMRKIEAERLRREFEEQQNAMRDKQEREAEERRRRVEAQKEAEAKQAEWLRQREEQREREYQEQMGRLILMQAEDRQRMETLDRKKHEKTMDLRRKKEEKERMLRDAAEKDAQLQRDKRMAWEEKCRKEQEKLMQQANKKAIQQEQNAKKQFQLMMKRKLAADEARRKLEDFQNSVLDHRQQVESRLQQHELKRKKYLEFKKELEGLKGRNKEMNIARQQRRENFRREQMAESLALKMAKAKVLEYEKTMLWNERRKVVAESNRQRELVKDRVAHMKEKSNYSARELEEMIRALSSPHRFSALYGDFDIAKTATVFQDSPVSTHRSMGTPVAGGRHTKSSPSLVQAGAATMAAH